MNQLHTLLNSWWTDFRSENPSAATVHRLLSAKESTVVHDHIALRTFDDQKVQIDTLMAPLVAAGYVCKEKYAFPKTHIFAQHYEHYDATLPKVFISHLESRQFSEEFQSTLGYLLSQIPKSLPGQWDFFVTARPWKIPFSIYETLKKESAYAAWVSAFGFRPTHFAIRTNSFEQYSELTTLNSFLKAQGFELNHTGGEIQGSPEVFLEQSSMKATETLVQFSDRMYPITGTYYEFAKRYSMPNGTLFNGFITESAENLFRSTHS
ncbi:MAG: succinyldiaminopimelate aminotransferase [Nitrospiraceae bacterium]|nr:succinyldiaminopimelate aminotransferase [Nitrospiraceae bacterium]